MQRRGARGRGSGRSRTHRGCCWDGYLCRWPRRRWRDALAAELTLGDFELRGVDDDDDEAFAVRLAETDGDSERERAAEQVRLRERRAAVVQELREQVLSLLALLASKVQIATHEERAARAATGPTFWQSSRRRRTRSLLALLVRQYKD